MKEGGKSITQRIADATKQYNELHQNTKDLRKEFEANNDPEVAKSLRAKLKLRTKKMNDLYDQIQDLKKRQ